MPLALIFLVAAWGVLFTSQVLEGGKPASLFSHPSPLILVFGVTMCITLVFAGMSDLSVIGKATLRALLPKKLPTAAETVELLATLAAANTKGGQRAMEKALGESGTKDPFLSRGLELVLEGVDSDQLEEILAADIAAMKERHKVGAEFWKSAGGYAPTIGILGTVMALVHVLEKLDEPSKLGASISTAFLATFWGVASANVIYLPIASKLKRMSAVEVLHRQLVLEGMLDLQAGRKEREVRAKLGAMLSPAQRAKLAGGKEPAKDKP